MTGPLHRFRPNVFVPERVFRLEDDALAWSDGRNAGRIPYADIVSLRIYAIPASIVPGMRRCVVRRRGGGGTVIGSTHYVRLGVTEDRSASWKPFVRELLVRVVAADPAVVLMTGQGWTMWSLWIALLAGSLAVLLGAAAALFAGDFPVGAIAAVAVVVALLPLCWRMAGRSRPRRLDAAGVEAAGLLE
ncbi:MAG: hypothetical protein IT561_17175 [Alphaproteobacteria bacterium]|nr:hypothetical protein [Alphaproteobacteria bacterium]